MERASLLSALSPQLQALVEASLGQRLPVGGSPAASAAPDAAGEAKSEDGEAKEQRRVAESPSAAAGSSVVRLNPSELFALKHPESPGFVVKEGFLGRQNALALREALVEYAKSADFHKAKIGAGEAEREESALRGDRIHWISRPRDLNDDSSSLAPAIRLFMRRVESLVFGVKRASPELDLRNITSTQLAIFPGDGSRFVRHTDTYATTHPEGVKSGGDMVRLITCVYYLNENWQPDHGGQLRVFVPESQFVPASQYDVPPRLDTLIVFRSHDVEHEVLPTTTKRMAVTIWYYGKRANPSSNPVTALSSSNRRDSAQVTTEPAALEVPSSASDSTKLDTIFVAIPSYRDPECRHTVDDLLKRATFPTRVSVGICLQETNDDDTREYLESRYASEKVRIDFIEYSEAAGPCIARARSQALWRGEKYYLQIDSHMRFRPGWDTFLIHELAKCEGSDKPILTTYPLGYSLPNEISRDCRPTILCARGFNEDGILRQSSKVLQKTFFSPIPSLFWAAGFAFSSSQVIEEVPYDASLRFLFFGEESSMSARMWTSGWDFFAPTEAVVYHLWTRSYRRTFHELEDPLTVQQRQQSLMRVKALMCGGEVNLMLPLGSRRSLDAYQRYIGVDFTNQKVEWKAEWGGHDPQLFDLSATSTK